MSTEITTEDVRRAATGQNVFSAPLAPERFDAWLAERDRQVAEQAGERIAAALVLTDAEWREFQQIPDQGYSHRAWLDARAARIARADSAAPARPTTDDRPFWRDLATGEPCPRSGPVLCAITDPNHLHRAIHMDAPTLLVLDEANATREHWRTVAMNAAAEVERLTAALASRPTTPTPTASEEQVLVAYRAVPQTGGTASVIAMLYHLGVTVTTDGGEG